MHTAKLSKLLLITLAILACTRAHIYSSQSKVTYDFSGNPLKYHIFLMLENGLGANDYLMINWPLRIHSGTDKSVVGVNLISFSNNLQIVSTTFKNYPVGSTTTLYYVTFGVALTAQKWYQIQMSPNVIPGALSPVVTLPFNGLIQIEAISNIVSNYITYDSNYAFRFISIQSNLATPGTITVGTSTSSVSANTVASIYTINIDITPTYTNANGGNFTLQIYYDSMNGVHVASGSGLLDFTFMGLCQSVTPATGAAAVLNNCEISSDLSTITFSVNTVTANQPIRIQTQVNNPMYVSTRGLRVYYVDFISGLVQENGYLATAFTVNQIAINDLGNQRVFLFWGISSENTDPELATLNLGLYKATGSNVGPFNSFNAGFSFSQTSPISGRYQVRMYLGASGFLEGSIAHNLPAYSSLKVYCRFDTVSKYEICDNVGPFINTNYRYFISGKAYYNSGSGSSVTGFGNVQIIPVVYDSNGNQLASVTLYAPLASTDVLTLVDSQEYIDSAGYHNPNNYKIGVAKIVSYPDDGTLSSTANAMNNFLRGTNSTIGIVPDLGVSQQLLLLMKVNSVAGGSGSGNSFKMRLLYNNQVIGFETGADTRGLDFVGYDNNNSVWSISYSPCYITNNVVCQKYNNDTPTANTQIRTTTALNPYGLYKFNCALAYSATATCFNGDCATACNLFTGYGTNNYQAGVMAMRKVTFPSTQFHSSMYADSNLLDFLVVFLQGTGFVAASLINAYTMVGTTMQNIKASYVNYFDYNAANYNKGERLPTMIRISGGVLPKESRNATVVGVFFDDNIDAQTFYTTKNSAYSVGCSTGNCMYYPNTGINLPPNDIWHTMRRVEFYSLPPIQNEFNLLVPVTPLANRYTYDSDPMPDTLTIAFFTTNYSIGDATNLLQTMSVYRLFGTVVTGNVSGSLTNINGLSVRGSNYFGTYFTTVYPSSYSGYGVGYYINTTNINANPPNNTFVYGYGGSLTNNGQYGCGVTLTSLYYNIFSSSTLAFESPPANTATTCSLFGYVYNEQTPGNNPDRDGKWIYVAFCPIDAYINLNSANGNIHFRNPQYPTAFTSNYYLRSVLTYGISDPSGQLVHYRQETGVVSAFTRTCTTAKLQAYNPSVSGSSGKQRATFTVSTPQIRMAVASNYDGYSAFQVTITLPSMSNINMLSGCLISDSQLSCTASGGSSSTTVTVNYIGTGVMTVTYFQLQLYASTSGSLGAGGDYTLTITLPQYTSNYVSFGTSFSNAITFCSCTSNFKIGNTAYGTGMIFQNPITLNNQFLTRSYYTINFGSYDYREAFFDTSYYQFGFGFLTEPSQTDRNTNNNFRCRVFENNAGNLTLSNKFSALDFSAFTSVKLYPKVTIDEPKNYLFTLGCYGSGVTSGANTGSMSLTWIDAGTNIQTAGAIAYSASNYIAAAAGGLTVSLTNKRFNTQGMKTLYSFSLTSTLALTESTRIYFNFHFKLSSLLDNEGYVECYLRSSAAIVDSAAIFTYCTFNQDRQLVIWNNLAVSASTTIYVDIYNIQVPKNTDTSPNLITVLLDSDSDYTNGVAQKTTVTDTASGGVAVSDIIITSTAVNTNFIRTPQTITIKFNTVTNVLVNAMNLYFLMPGPYGEWINRGQVLPLAQCFLQADNAVGTNKLGSCTFISKRILKMTLNANTNYNLHTLVLTGVYSPSMVPSGRYNQFRFKLYTTSNSATEPDINRFSFTDLSKTLSLQPDSTLIDLSWKYYSLTITSGDSLVQMTDISTQTYIIYIGYFANVIELRESIYPSNFILEMSLVLANYPVASFIHKNGASIHLGVQNTFLRIAANTGIAAGLYTLQYNKTGDDSNKYTATPPLTIVVSNKLCKLQAREVSYSMPKGGLTVPIVIDGSNCIPINNITITPTFNSSEVVMDTSLSAIVLSSSVVDGQLYVVARHNFVTLPIGALVTLNFVIAGPNAIHFDVIPTVSISIVDPAPYQTLPTATGLASPSLSYNQATFTLQCSMASKIYWGLGLYPSILNTQALDFEARIISGSTGLLTNFTEPEDYYMRVYGVNYVTTTQTLPKSVYNLKSNAQYIFKYFCVNQMGLISDGQSITFNSLNYGAYLMKVSIIFNGSITYGQYGDLACSLAQNFGVRYERIMTQAMSTCGGAITPFYSQTTDKILKQANSNGEYVYNFYILPDYTIPIDQTNANIRSALTLSSTSTTIITSTNNVISLPGLVQMQTEDIQFFASSAISISSPISGLSSIVVTAMVTNMNGFIIIGCMNGVFDSSTMTYPVAASIKKGLLSTNVPLLQVKMIQVIQNYNVTFSFSGLSDNTEYTFFYFATTEDPTISAQSSTVGSFNAMTLQALIVDINFGQNMQVMWMAVFVALWLLLN